MSQKETFYHITEQKEATSIFKNGIHTKIGPRSSAVGEVSPRIYLTKKEDILPWHLTLPLERPYILELTVSDTFVKEHIKQGCKYALSNRPYMEYLCNIDIKPNQINHPIALPKVSPEETHELVVNGILNLSNIVVKIIKFLDQYEANPESRDQIETDITYYYEYAWQLAVYYMVKLAKIDAYKYLDIPKAKKTLEALGENGEYTLCDAYEQTDIPLWEYLSTHTCPLVKDIRQQITDCINTHIPWIKDLSTGGYENPYTP